MQLHKQNICSLYHEEDFTTSIQSNTVSFLTLPAAIPLRDRLFIHWESTTSWLHCFAHACQTADLHGFSMCYLAASEDLNFTYNSPAEKQTFPTEDQHSGQHSSLLQVKASRLLLCPSYYIRARKRNRSCKPRVIQSDFPSNFPTEKQTLHTEKANHSY